MDRLKAPCMGCEKRHPACQSDTCPEWKAWHEQWQQERTKIYRKRWLDDACRKIGRKKPRESHTAKIFRDKSHRKERPNGSRMAERMDADNRLREEVRKREGGD